MVPVSTKLQGKSFLWSGEVYFWCSVCCLDPSCPLLPHSYIFRHSWILDTLKWSDSMIILIWEITWCPPIIRPIHFSNHPPNYRCGCQDLQVHGMSFRSGSVATIFWNVIIDPAVSLNNTWMWFRVRRERATIFWTVIILLCSLRLCNLSVTYCASLSGHYDMAR